MYIVIVGGGRIGRHIARDMVTRGHQVTIIEQQAQRCQSLLVEHDVLLIEGDAGDIHYLEQAHVDRADVFVATTHTDHDNLVACQLARAEFGVSRAISRVNSPKNVEIFERLGIEAVSSTRFISEMLESEFTVNDLVRLTSLRGGRVALLEITVPDGVTPHDADGDGRGDVLPAPPTRSIQDLGLPDESVLAAIFRGDETIIPHGVATIEPGDEVLALTTPDHQELVRSILVGEA